MKHIPEEEIRDSIISILRGAITHDYAAELADNDRFVALVREDVETASALGSDGYYSDYDVCLAIGRVIFYLFIGGK